MDGTRPTQALVVLDGGHLTHEKTVLAVAHASFLPTMGRLGAEPWGQWLAGGMAKSVRRVKPNKFFAMLDARDRGEPDHEGARVSRIHGSFNIPMVLSFPPAPMGRWPMGVLKAQVSHFDRPRDEALWDRGAELLLARGTLDRTRPCLVVDSSLGMTTGKEAAQAAHAMWLCGEDLPEEWLPSPWIVRVGHQEFLELSQHARHRVVDNGHTELDPGTTTVLVL